jgi:hypothetical protein
MVANQDLKQFQIRFSQKIEVRIKPNLKFEMNLKSGFEPEIRI